MEKCTGDGMILVEWKRWFIMTEDGVSVVARYHGTREEAERYCQDVYRGTGYRIARDNRNENHPINRDKA